MIKKSEILINDLFLKLKKSIQLPPFLVNQENNSNFSAKSG